MHQQQQQLNPPPPLATPRPPRYNANGGRHLQHTPTTLPTPHPHPQPTLPPSQQTPVSWLSRVSGGALPSALDSQTGNLIVLALAVCLASGVLVRTFHPRYRYRAASSSSSSSSLANAPGGGIGGSSKSKRRQDVLDSILKAQHSKQQQQQQQEGSSERGRKCAQSTSGAAAKGKGREVDVEVGGGRGDELKPSESCVASTSKAIMRGLADKIGSVASGVVGAATKARAKTVAGHQNDAKDSVSSSSSTLSFSAFSTAPPDALQKRRNGATSGGGGKKGKGPAVQQGGGAGKNGFLGVAADDLSASRSPPSSSATSRSPRRRESVPNALETTTTRMPMLEIGVQTSPTLERQFLRIEDAKENGETFEEQEGPQTPPPLSQGDFPGHEAQAMYTPTPRHRSPFPEPHESIRSDCPPSATAPPSPSPSPSSSLTSIPPGPLPPSPRLFPVPTASRPALSTTTKFDFHSSFQATPPLAPPHPPLPASYPLPASPPLSPTPSPSQSPSTTSSNSPARTGRRASTVSIAASSSSCGTSAGGAGGGGLLAPSHAATAASSASPSPSSSRSRKQARKQSVASSNAAIPGMPRTATADGGQVRPPPPPVREASASGSGSGSRSRILDGGGGGGRRASTASSSAGSSAGGGGMGMTPSDGGGAGGRRSSASGSGSGRKGGKEKGKGREAQQEGDEEALHGWNGRTSLKGLGVDMDDETHELAGGAGGGRGAVYTPSPYPYPLSSSYRPSMVDGYFSSGPLSGGVPLSLPSSSSHGLVHPHPLPLAQPAPVVLSSSRGAGAGGAGGFLTSPESSPHPTHRSLHPNALHSLSTSTTSSSSSSSPFPPPTGASATLLQTPQGSKPFSTQIMASMYNMSPAPAPGPSTPTSVPNSNSAQHASRPPSRGAALSSVPTPPVLSRSQTEGQQVTQSQQLQAQVLAAQQQQQQQQMAAYQAQVQAQAQYQQQAAYLQQQQQYQAQVVQQQQQQQQRLDRSTRRRTMTSDEMSDGLLSPNMANPVAALSSSTSSNASANGLVYPLSSSTSSHPASPLMSTFSLLSPHHGQQQPQFVGMSQGISPTTSAFPPNVQHLPPAALAAVNAQAAYAGGYLGSPVAAGSPSVAYGLASPTSHGYAQQQAQGGGQPARPRLSSSVSAVAALGSSSTKGERLNGSGNGSIGRDGKSSSTSREKAQRGMSTSSTHTSAHTPSTPGGGPGSNGLSSSSSNNGSSSAAIAFADTPGVGWKAKFRVLESDMLLLQHKLEFAEWAAEKAVRDEAEGKRETAEEMRILQQRAIRAETRVKILEKEKAERDSALATVNGDVPRANGVGVPAEAASGGEEEPESLENSPSRMHQLAWVDLDSVSFGNPRPLSLPAERSPRFNSVNGGGGSNGGNNRDRRRNNRALWGSNNGGGGYDAHPGMGRRKSSGGRRKSGNLPSLPPPVPPVEVEGSSDDDVVLVLDAPNRRRSAQRQQPPSRRSSYLADDDGGPNVYSSPSPAGFQLNLPLDDDEVPSIDIDEAEPMLGGAVMGRSDDGARMHPEYIGFLPTFLRPGSSSSTSGGSPRCWPESEAELAVPGFSLDAPTPEEEEEDPVTQAPNCTSELETQKGPTVVPLPNPSSSSVIGDGHSVEPDDEEEPTPTAADEEVTAVLPSPASPSLQPPVPILDLSEDKASHTSFYPLTAPPVNEVEQDDTPRIAPPPSPPSPPPSFSRRPSFGTPRRPRRGPEDTPLPPSPLVSTSA
ncbi:hypothetical protein JCM11251_002791 [Rhodosporidiobolus azoricus]